MATSTQPKVQGNQEQLARLQAEVEALREQLRSAHRLATVGTMTAMVAHEFNNILTPIINYAQMARKNPTLVDKALTCVADGGVRATNICRALLDATRSGPAEPQAVLVADVVSSAFNAMGRSPAKDGIEVQTRVPVDLKVTTRPVELQQVLLNLFINARSAVLANPPPRRIEISAERGDGRTVIHIADNGTGIAPENLDRIFLPFFSTKNGLQGDSQGSGLGLTFCREIMTRLGGEISVRSAPSKGATFSLYLPD